MSRPVARLVAGIGSAAFLLGLSLMAFVQVRALGAPDDAQWPSNPMPPTGHEQSMGNPLLLNGRTSQLTQVTASLDAVQLTRFYQDALGPQVVTETVNGMPVVASQRGDYFWTVQIQEQEPSFSQATVLVTRMQTAHTSAIAQETRQWLPPDSAVLSSLQSSDAGLLSLMLVAVNRNGIQANRDHLVHAMQARGFGLMQDTESARADIRGRVLRLASAAEEVVVTVADAGAYRTITLHRTREAR